VTQTHLQSSGSALFWFRRDLRDEDNAGLSAALNAHGRVYCVFVFDRNILQELPARTDRRVEFIWHSVHELHASLQRQGGGLITLHGVAQVCIPTLAQELGVQAVYINHDYEPAAQARDNEIAEQLAAHGIALHSRRDQVIFEKRELLTQGGTPFTVFTPYRNAWLKAFDDERMRRHVIQPAYLAPDPLKRCLPTLSELGFEKTNLLALGIAPGMSGAQKMLNDFMPRMGQYHERRDYPGVRGVSYLSVHLRFGTVSLRELVRRARAEDNLGAACWLNELIWRDFYFSILFNFPHVVTNTFKPQWNDLVYDNRPDLFEAWKTGCTGYPLVDAAMRQLAQTGFMHNRLRMIAASFLIKDLGIDWRWGERHFAEQLNDFDLSANNGGWQWSASTGCDAQPWFRLFNPVTQSKRFDAEGHFIRRYLPQLAQVPSAHIHAPWSLTPIEQSTMGCVIGVDYPAPIVDHAIAREKTLARYKRVAHNH